jgi:hypothetical protein
MSMVIPVIRTDADAGANGTNLHAYALSVRR